MGRKPPGRARRSKGKRPIGLDKPVATGPLVETIRSQLAALAPAKRKRTILLMEGTNALTGRPVRIYIRPDNTLVAAETMGQMEYK